LYSEFASAISRLLTLPTGDLKDLYYLFLLLFRLDLVPLPFFLGEVSSNPSSLFYLAFFSRYEALNFFLLFSGVSHFSAAMLGFFPPLNVRSSFAAGRRQSVPAVKRSTSSFAFPLPL